MHVINQPWDGRDQRVGDHIVRLLAQARPPFDTFVACVAYVKASGMLRLAPAMEAFTLRGGQVTIIAGIDEGITTRQGLELALHYSSHAYIFNNPGHTFHPKVYTFEQIGHHAIAFIGSSNLTSGGLYTNYETMVALEFDLTSPVQLRAHQEIRSLYERILDPRLGNAQVLDDTLLDHLVQNGRVSDESRPAVPDSRRPIFRRRHPPAEPIIFPRTPVLPPPPIDGRLRRLVPRVQRTGDEETDRAAVTAFEPVRAFVMTLGTRDTRQEAGYSRDIYIPIAARDHDRLFWGWPALFRRGRNQTVGTYDARTLRLRIRSAGGNVQEVPDVRLYYYHQRHEFRLNCGPLVEGSGPGDLLVIQSPSGPTARAVYEATIIANGHPMYQPFLTACRSQVRGSTKRWGYI